MSKIPLAMMRAILGINPGSVLILILPMLQISLPGKMKMGTGKNIYFCRNLG